MKRFCVGNSWEERKKQNVSEIPNLGHCGQHGNFPGGREEKENETQKYIPKRQRKLMKCCLLGEAVGSAVWAGSTEDTREASTAGK